MSGRSRALWIVLTLAAIAAGVAAARQIAATPVALDKLSGAPAADLALGPEAVSGVPTTESARAEALGIIRERPLFIRSRRPPQPRPAVAEPSVVESAPVIDAAPPPEPEPPPEFVLVGVRIDTEGKRALIRIGASSVGEWRREGDSLEGWKIETIQSSVIIMRRGDMTLELALYHQAEPPGP